MAKMGRFLSFMSSFLPLMIVSPPLLQRSRAQQRPGELW
jgi:hypothetical protein